MSTPVESQVTSSERRLRRLLALTLAIGMLGTALELLLLGHTEERNQLIPLVAIGFGVVALASVPLLKRPAGVRALQIVMVAFAVTGLLGLYYHYRGNAEFELELYPSMAGWELFREALTGATPALAPGSMVLLALLGLAYCHQHPMLGTRGSEPSLSTTDEGVSR